MFVDTFNPLLALAVLIGLALLGALGWRLAGRLYSLPCPSWLSWLLENPLAGNLDAHTAVLRLDLRPGMHVLDVGCGPGRLTVPVAQQVGPTGNVVALDIQPAMLRRAREKAVVAGLQNIQFILAGAGDGRLEQDFFDRALLVTVLGEIPNREAALKEIFAALKPGGILSVAEVIYDPHFQSRSAVLRLAGRAGFRQLAFFGNSLAYTLNLEKP